MDVITNTVYLFTIMYTTSIITAQHTSVFPNTDTDSSPSIFPELILDTLSSPLKREERHFFHTGITTCNYAITPGRTCHSCRHTMTCLQSDTAFVKRCHFFAPYCNNGFCSTTPGSLCSPTSSSTTSTTLTSSMTTTVAP